MRPEEEVAVLRGITLEDLRRVARAALACRNATVVRVGPRSTSSDNSVKLRHENVAGQTNKTPSHVREPQIHAAGPFHGGHITPHLAPPSLPPLPRFLNMVIISPRRPLVGSATASIQPQDAETTRDRDGARHYYRDYRDRGGARRHYRDYRDRGGARLPLPRLQRQRRRPPPPLPRRPRQRRRPPPLPRQLRQRRRPPPLPRRPRQRRRPPPLRTTKTEAAPPPLPRRPPPRLPRQRRRPPPLRDDHY